MTAYHQIINSKLTSIFEESQQSSDRVACLQRVNQLVTVERDRFFKNGIRWAKQNRFGRSRVQYRVERGNDEVLQGEVEVQA